MALLLKLYPSISPIIGTRKIGRFVRDRKIRTPPSSNTRSSATRSRPWWNYISAGYGGSQFYAADRFHVHDWRTGTYKPNIPNAWIAYHLATIAISGSTFAAGLGILMKLWGK